MQQFAICIDNSDYPASLVSRKLYAVLPDSSAAETKQIRVIDESGDDYLYPANCFIELDLPSEIETRVAEAP